MRAIRPRMQRGFTFIEIMIAVIIVTILAGIAWPAYQDYVFRARRAEAKSHLMQMVQCMERFNTSNTTYIGGPDRCQAPNNQFYNLAYADVARSTFRIIAAPVDTQATDACGQLGIDQAGAKTHGGSEADRCW